MEYVVGEAVRLSATFRNSTGAKANPTGVTLHYQKGNATPVTDASPTNSATGEYYVDVDLDAPGIWKYDWVATGVVKAVLEGQFMVRARRIQV